MLDSSLFPVLVLTPKPSPGEVELYLYLYLPGGQLKPPSAETVYIWPNAQPQYDQRSGKPLSGSRKPKKSGWCIFAQFLRLHGICSHNGVSRYHIGPTLP